MIFGALSNAAYRVSLRGPGAEIEGGSQEPPPPSGGGKSRGPSGRGLMSKIQYNKTKTSGPYQVVCSKTTADPSTLIMLDLTMPGTQLIVN